MANLTVETEEGPVRGVVRDGVRQWLGVPYATADRFGAPRPARRRDAVRPAKSYPPRCPQVIGYSYALGATSPPQASEDCLTLNIYAPNQDKGPARPVMVWIHGGAFTLGTGNMYNGRKFAEDHGIIVVSINYRVGVLGFVNFPEVLGIRDCPSNLGLRDQIAALEWIRDNIAAFGGDPGRVTVAGESAGSISISLLMVSDRARGLFHGAILQSGALSLIHSRPHSVRLAERYVTLLELEKKDLKELRVLPLKKLLKVQAKIDKETYGVAAAPWYDGDLLPRSLDRARETRTPDIPIIAGANREEMRFFEKVPGDILPSKRKELTGLVDDQLDPAHARRIEAVYPDTRDGNRAFATDLTFAMPTRNFAARHAANSPAWLYRFDYDHYYFGAGHAMDLLFLWPLDTPLAPLLRGGFDTGERRALAEGMQAEWAHFVVHGKPGGQWKPYTEEDRQVQIFGPTPRMERDPHGVRTDAWAGRDVVPLMD